MNAPPPPLPNLLGALHLHSRRSFDGTLDHARIRALLLEAGYRFAGMTEHIEGLTPDLVRRTIDDCRNHSDPEFLFIPGIEMDRFTVYFLGVATEPDWSDDAPEAIFHNLRQRSRLMVLAHPIKARFAFPEAILAQCDGVEILNARHDGLFTPRPQSLRLLEQARRLRPGATALAGMDLHRPSDLRPAAVRLLDPTPLEERPILDALAAGRCDILLMNRPLGDFTPLERMTLGARQRMMDAAHAAHRLLRRIGLTPPAPLKRRLRRLFEGEGDPS